MIPTLAQIFFAFTVPQMYTAADYSALLAETDVVGAFSAIERCFVKKRARTNKIVVFKACAHKLARAAFYVMRDQVNFDEALAFG